MQSRRVPAITMLVLILAGSTATATHWTAGENGIGPAHGATAEPDQAVFRLSGHELDGMANAVTHPGRSAGDGGLFLDATLAARFGIIDVPFARALGDFTARPTMLVPAQNHAEAWYGEWNDLDRDGIIDDVHDTSAAPGDEFVWHGAGDGNPGVAVVMFMTPPIPSNGGVTVDASGLRAGGVLLSGATNQTRTSTHQFQDLTARTRAEQSWNGPTITSLDASFLTSIQTVTVAGAPAAPGTPLGWSVRDPAALRDVDRYESVSPEVASLWGSAIVAMHEADRTQQAALRPVFESTYAVLIPTITGAIAAATAIAGDADGFVRDTYTPIHPKEPNTAFDDHEGRALFGGVGDHAGSHNTYAAFAEGWHFFADVRARTPVCAGAYAAVPGTSTEQSTALCFGALAQAGDARDIDPAGAQAGTARSSGALLSFEVDPLLWFDRNGDTHIGAVCDPASDDFDAQRNTCRNPPRPWPMQGDGWLEELRYVCRLTDATGGGTLTVRPADWSSWTQAFLVQDARTPTAAAYGSKVLPLTGSDPAILRWNDACSGNTLRARDAILFADGGSRIPLIVRTTLGIAGFDDGDAGISLGAERVIDVDRLPAAL